MGNGGGVSRGDRNRDAGLERLRVLVPVTDAVAGTGLAGGKQMAVVTDHGPEVIARRVFRCRAWDSGPALDWAAGRATASGWAGVRVWCEPGRAPVAGAGPAGGGPAGAVGVRAAAGHLVVAADRGSGLR